MSRLVLKQTIITKVLILVLEPFLWYNLITSEQFAKVVVNTMKLKVIKDDKD